MRPIFIIVLALLISFSAQSQDLVKEKKATFGISHSMGLFGDNFIDMDYDMISSRSEQMQNIGYNLDGMKVMPLYQTVVSTYAGVSLNRKVTNARGVTNELSVGVNLVPMREPMLEYNAIDDDNPNRNVLFCVMESEVNIQASYLRQISFANIKQLKLHIGPSVNAGTTFNNEFLLMTETVSDHAVKSHSENNVVSVNPTGEGTYDQNGNWSGQYLVHEEQWFNAKPATMLRIRLNVGVQYDFNNRWTISTQVAGGKGWQQIPNWGTEEFYNYQTNIKGIYWF